MKCDIIMPIWDELEFTRDCINSIINGTRPPYRLILIDNNSEKDTRVYLESVAQEQNPEVKLIRNEENLGFIKAVNRGLKESNAPYICVMNNDTLVTDGWLSEMIKVAEEDPRIALVNPSSNNLGQKPPSGDITRYARTLKEFGGEFIEMGACLGFCMLLKREIFKKIGPFDETYGVGLFDDTDYSRKAESLGYVCVRAKAAYVHHRVSKSFRRKKDFEDMFTKNQGLFYKRWGRPKRLLYIMSKDHARLHDWIRAESMEKARFGNWIWLFLKRNLPFQMREHSNVRIFHLPDIFFKENCIYRILKRKKKFDSIYVDTEDFREKLDQFKRFHNADVMLMGG